MIIDFTKLERLIPSVKDGEKEKNGSLSLVIKKTGETLSVIFAPKFTGEENNPDFAPVVLTGTAEELSAEFDGIEETVRLLNESLLPGPAAAIAKKNTAIKSARDKNKKAAVKTEVKTEAAPEPIAIPKAEALFAEPAKELAACAPAQAEPATEVA